MRLIPVILTLIWTSGVASEVPVAYGEVIAAFGSPAARQGVAVDAAHVYVAGNYRIIKHERATGAAIEEWAGEAEGRPLTHLDSAMVHDGLLYAAHSNYPGWPMTSSVEVWDAATMRHVGTHSFGIQLGSFTWLDRHAGVWWGAFANYDKVQTGQSSAYGETRRTQIVRMDDDFAIKERWVLPESILERMRPMSNSGGSWGPDGLLYLTGHDHGEIYVTCLPAAGSTIIWLGTVRVDGMEGQGIAWDRSADEPELWAILKQDRQVLRVRMPDDPALWPRDECRPTPTAP